MKTVTIYGEQYQCAKAIKGRDFVQLLDITGTRVAEFSGISDFSGYEGDWDAPEPTAEDQIRADVDYLLIAELAREGIINVEPSEG